MNIDTKKKKNERVNELSVSACFTATYRCHRIIAQGSVAVYLFCFRGSLVDSQAACANDPSRINRIVPLLPLPPVYRRTFMYNRTREENRDASTVDEENFPDRGKKLPPFEPPPSKSLCGPKQRVRMRSVSLVSIT